MAQIQTLVFEDGERYPLIILDSGVPDFFPTLYVTINLRPRLAANSIRNALRDIQHLTLWEDIQGRDLMEEFRRGVFLSEGDIESLRNHCALDSRHLRNWHNSIKNPQVRRISESLSRNRLMPAVAPPHKAGRLRRIADYLTFCAKTIHRCRSEYDEFLVPRIERMHTHILKQVPRGISGTDSNLDPDAKAPQPEVFEKLLAVTREESLDNPFLSPVVRERNARMFDVLAETGMRSGEVLALQIDDIDFHNATIAVVRRPDSPYDSRSRQPTAKTRPRVIPVMEEIVIRLKKYIMGARAKTPGANRHPFVFVTHRRGRWQGNPISDTAFRQRILGKVIQVDDELFHEVCRHGFRHWFNYRLSKKIDLNNKLSATGKSGFENISEASEISIRKYLNGWSSHVTAETYNLRHTQEKADYFQRLDMDEMTKKLKLNEVVHG